MNSASVQLKQSPWTIYFLPMLPLIGYGIWLVESAFARPNPAWAALLLVWALSAGLLAWWLMRGGAGRILEFLNCHANTVALGLIVVAAAVLVGMSILQARYFAVGAHAEDTAYYNQVLWNTLHGNFLSGNVQQERLYSPPVSNDLALHVSPVLVVGLLPIYALFPHFLTLLIVRDVALAAAAWPLFLLARERMGGVAGIAAVILYLANPAVIAQGFEAFYLLHLAPLPFFWALRAFVREELGSFLLWMAIAISMREDVTIAMAGFGLWALVSGRKLRWANVGLGIPIVWWGLANLLIQPAFGRTADVTLVGVHQTPIGISQMLLGNPLWLLDALRAGGLDYLYQLLRSVAFLSALGIEGLLVAPGVTATLFLGRIADYGHDPFSRFALLPSCALIGAAVVIVSRMGRRSHGDMQVFAVLMLLLLPSVNLLDGVKDAIQTRLAFHTVHNDATALWKALEQIPGPASVAAPNYALPALANRPKLFYVTYLRMYPQAQPDYILLDRDVKRVTVNPELQARYVTLLETLSRSTEYETMWQRGDYFLLRRHMRHASAT